MAQAQMWRALPVAYASPSRVAAPMAAATNPMAWLIAFNTSSNTKFPSISMSFLRSRLQGQLMSRCTEVKPSALRLRSSHSRLPLAASAARTASAPRSPKLLRASRSRRTAGFAPSPLHTSITPSSSKPVRLRFSSVIVVFLRRMSPRMRALLLPFPGPALEFDTIPAPSRSSFLMKVFVERISNRGSIEPSQKALVGFRTCHDVFRVITTLGSTLT
mmetsp:Transcript_43503/g.75128  ORF Transcript_43503/g.75128 Transcript_43503/m.75128 type:complete len:217 (-) Transcript_43503:269-919(-)